MRSNRVPDIRGNRRLRNGIVAGAAVLLVIAGLSLNAVASAPSGSSASGLIGALSARQQAGERVIYSYRGLRPPASLLAQIRAGEAAGVIFFKSNISGPAQIKHVVAQLEAAARRSPVKAPLLLMTDQEGGEVRRLPGAPTLSEKEIGESPTAQSQARMAGRGAGLNLKAVGLDVNLAPVLDVYRSPGDFIDRYGRSYSDDPRAVAQLGAGFIRAQQQTGVAATAKHFPGLGAAGTQQDTDTEPVRIDLPLSALRATDEWPYRAAVAAHVKLVMLSWAVYPALDPRRPAGLSPTVIQGELRRRLAFRGVTITDALEAGALRPFGSTAKRAVLAAQAGDDLLLCASQRVDQGVAAVRALTDALRSGRLPSSSFTASVRRVLALRSHL